MTILVDALLDTLKTTTLYYQLLVNGVIEALNVVKRLLATGPGPDNGRNKVPPGNARGDGVRDTPPPYNVSLLLFMAPLC